MVIGVTGNFGVGKTTVANMFGCLGAQVIDADRIAHSMIKPYSSTYRKIVASFGRTILTGIYINRKKLADIVFSDKKKINKLNRIMHAEILRRIKSRIEKLSDKEILIVDAALLIESGLLPWIDRLVVVKLKPEIQMQRLEKSGKSYKDIKGRLCFQSTQHKKISHADFVIDNSGTRSHTERQVKMIWSKVVKNGGKIWKN